MTPVFANLQINQRGPIFGRIQFFFRSCMKRPPRLARLGLADCTPDDWRYPLASVQRFERPFHPEWNGRRSNMPGITCRAMQSSALKACVAKGTHRYDFPDKKSVDASYTHNL